MQTFEIVWLLASTAALLVLYGFARRYTAAKYMLFTAFLGLNLIYLLWRTAFTLPTIGLISLVAGILLLLTEWAGYFQSIVFTILSWKPFKRKSVPLSTFKDLPTVDVFIATYNEPAELLKRTIAASLMMRYPAEKMNVYVCDDGRRADIRQLAESMGANYLDRRDNAHQKAGNLNHAMQKTNGDIIVTMDADMVPKANFLERTVGHFIDEKVCFVQAPQVFYNADAFQYNLFFEDNITNEQDFFMRRLEEGKDRFNATMYVGSNALFRRSALEEIGGFATGVITEDMATGMLLQTNGRKSVFINETLAVGLSPETFSDLIKQRDRWCRGNIQVMRKWNPLTVQGLGFMQRLLYLDGIHYWFFGVYKMIYLLAPLLFLLFSIYSLETDFSTLLLYWIPSFLSSQLAFRRMAENKRSTLWSHVYEVALAPYMAVSALTEFIMRRAIKFNVTRKGIKSYSREFRWTLSLPYIILITMNGIGLIMIGIHLFTPATLYDSTDMLYINLFWVVYNTSALIIAFITSFERPRFRGAERFPISIDAKIKQQDGAKHSVKVVDLSENGARLEIKATETARVLSAGHAITLSSGNFANVKIEREWVSQKDNTYIAGVSFKGVSLEQYQELIRILFAEAEDIYSDRKYVKSSLWMALISFFRHTESKPKSSKRQSIREKANDACVLYNTENQSMESTIVDYSITGCRIQIRKKQLPIKKGGIFYLDYIDSKTLPQQAQVQWIKRKGFRGYVAGLQFVQEEAGSHTA
jgi:cellulose synthase (UDP-forming)